MGIGREKREGRGRARVEVRSWRREKWVDGKGCVVEVRALLIE
jgi:hypothetical protein